MTITILAYGARIQPRMQTTPGRRDSESRFGVSFQKSRIESERGIKSRKECESGGTLVIMKTLLETQLGDRKRRNKRSG